MSERLRYLDLKLFDWMFRVEESTGSKQDDKHFSARLREQV